MTQGVEVRIANALERIADVLEQETKRGGAFDARGIAGALFEVADAVNNQEANR
jgi:hypothetical protein